jgi:hypothetical protein
VIHEKADSLSKIFIKTEITLGNNIPRNINASVPRREICAAVFIPVTVLNFCLRNTRKINRLAAFSLIGFHTVTV